MEKQSVLKWPVVALLRVVAQINFRHVLAARSIRIQQLQNIT